MKNFPEIVFLTIDFEITVFDPNNSNFAIFLSMKLCVDPESINT